MNVKFIFEKKMLHSKLHMSFMTLLVLRKLCLLHFIPKVYALHSTGGMKVVVKFYTL